MEYISQLIPYFRAVGSYHEFLDRGLILRVILTNDHGYAPFVVIIIGFFPHS
jgi:hypothetical protein